MSAIDEKTRKAIGAAIFDPGATEGLKGDRTLTEWQVDAVVRALSQEGKREPMAWKEFDHTTIDYVLRYNGRCRECADHHGLCPNGLPCDVDDAKAAIRWVLKALNYGISNGFLTKPSVPEVRGEGARPAFPLEVLIEQLGTANVSCHHCHGNGRHQGIFGGRSHPLCGYCGGTGKLRISR